MSTPMTFAKIVGRLALVVGDNNDPDDFPQDVYPDPGSTAVVTPSMMGAVKGTNVAGKPITRALAPIPCTFDSVGQLTYNGKPFVYVVDLGGPGVNPSIPRDEVAYTISFSITVAGAPVEFPTIQLNPVAGEETDFTDWIKLRAPSGAAIVQGPPGPPGPAGDGTGGVAVGGTSGQVLAKASSADFDTYWVTPSTGGGGSSLPSSYVVSDRYFRSGAEGTPTGGPGGPTYTPGFLIGNVDTESGAAGATPSLRIQGPTAPDGYVSVDTEGLSSFRSLGSVSRTVSVSPGGVSTSSLDSDLGEFESVSFSGVSVDLNKQISGILNSLSLDSEKVSARRGAVLTEILWADIAAGLAGGPSEEVPISLDPGLPAGTKIAVLPAGVEHDPAAHPNTLAFVIPN